MKAGRFSLPAFDGRFRLAFVLFGGMLVLQSSKTLDAAKIVYLVGTFLCITGALAVVWRTRRTSAVGAMTPWLGTSVALVALVAISFLVSRAQGTSSMDWVRDAAAYALFAAVPVLALDAQASASRKVLVAILVFAGLLGGVSWAAEWLGRRHIVDLPFSRLVLPTGQLPSLLYLLAMATAMTGGRRSARWAVLAGVVLGLFLITGTRSSLLLLVGPLAMAVVLGRARIRASLGPLLLHGVVAVGLVLVVQLAISLPAVLGSGPISGEPGSSAAPGGARPTPGSNVVGERIGSLPVLAGNPASDPSVKERVAQYQASWVLFLSSPIVGVGPGHPINWIDVSRYQRSAYTADTPLVMVAKFGVLGILVFSGIALAFGATLRRASRSVWSPTSLTLVGFGLLVVVNLPLGFPVEDKGFSLALILLLALALKGAPDTVEHPASSVQRPSS